MPMIRKKTIQGIGKGTRFTITRTFTQSDVNAFADISRDYNPVHFDNRFAKEKSFSRPVCHGLLVGGMLTEIGGQIGWLASEMNFRFLKPVYPGDTIECTFTITGVDDRNRAVAEVFFKNQEGENVLTSTLKGILPGKREIEVMSHMVSEGDPTNGLHTESCFMFAEDQ